MTGVDPKCGVIAPACAPVVAQTVAAQGDQVLTVRAVADAQILIKQLKIRQGYSKVVDGNGVVVVLFAVADQRGIP